MSNVQPPKSLKEALKETSREKYKENKAWLKAVSDQPKGIIQKRRREKAALAQTLVDMHKDYPELMKKAFYRKAQTTD